MRTELLEPNVTTWTLLVRITHWLAAICVLINFFNESGAWHRIIGYVCLGLVVLRMCDGLWFANKATSRFQLPGTTDVMMHIKALLTGRAVSHVGHNPLGQYAVYLIWLLIILLGFTGWLSRTDSYWGEDWPVDLHETLSALLQGMVVLHLLAVAVMSKLQGINLVWAMVNGK